MVENNEDLIIKVVICINAQVDVSLPTTCDVDASVLTTGSLDGVKIMEEVLPTSDNKND